MQRSLINSQVLVKNVSMDLALCCPRASPNMTSPLRFDTRFTFTSITGASGQKPSTVCLIILNSKLIHFSCRITSGVVYVPTVTPPCLPHGISRMYEAMSAARHDYHGATVPTPNPITDPASWFKLPVTTLRGCIASTGKRISVQSDVCLPSNWHPVLDIYNDTFHSYTLLSRYVTLQKSGTPPWVTFLTALIHAWNGYPLFPLCIER